MSDTAPTTGTTRVKRGMAEMLKGGVIMDVVTPDQAKIAEDAGAVAVMALERVPADIRAQGGVARMSDPDMIDGIIAAVSIPVMAKARIGHFVAWLIVALAEYERELIVERVNAGIAAARQNGTRFGRPPVDPAVIAEKLEIAGDARAKGRTAEDAARLVGWSRATLYRHRQAARAREAVAEQV